MGRLLAVDDSADSAELVARVAAKCGYDARSISDPTGLDRLLRDWRPEVLTLDLCMPEADGIGLMSVLKENGFDGQLVIISGQDGWLRKAAARLAEGRGLQVAADLEKPIDLAVLRQLLIGLSSPRIAAADVPPARPPAIDAPSAA
jgi:two-component system chemotaxis response regulator CheB